MTDKSGKDSAPLERHVVLTDDGSSSIVIPEMDEMYHSRKGAIRESQFVYIDHGLLLHPSKNLRVLEVGMGTGLNALLTYQASRKHQLQIEYHTLEPYPLTEGEWKSLNYADGEEGRSDAFTRIHESDWNTRTTLDENLSLLKLNTTLEHVQLSGPYDVVYFDAFAPNKQASPWHIDNLRKCFEAMAPDSILTTYCAQGQFKRNLKSVGFRLTHPEGPMGKREITVAYK